MRNKIIIMLLAAALILILRPSHVQAADQDWELDLNGAVTRALNQNPDLLLTKQKLAVAHDRYLGITDNLDSQKSLQEIAGLQNQIEEQQREIELNVTKLYFEILIKMKQISLQEDIVNRSRTEYDAKNKEVGLGRDVESSLLTCEINLKDEENTLEDLKNDLMNSYMDLNIELGDGLNKEPVLKDEELPDDSFNIGNLDEIISVMKENSYSIKSIEKDIDIAVQESNEASDADAIDQANDKILDLMNQLNDEKINVEYNIRTGYNDVLSSEDDMEIKKLDYEKAVKAEDETGIRYKHGLVTAMDYEKVGQDAKGTQYAYLLASLYYYIEARKYKNSIEPAL